MKVVHTLRKSSLDSTVLYERRDAFISLQGRHMLRADWSINLDCINSIPLLLRLGVSRARCDANGLFPLTYEWRPEKSLNDSENDWNPCTQ